jgi:hypothetical protein
MNTKMKIAFAAVLFSTFAAPSFAASQDAASVQENSGRVFPTYMTVPHAYASAARSGWMHSADTRDFQLQGRGVGR